MNSRGAAERIHNKFQSRTLITNIVVDKSTDHAKPLPICFRPRYQLRIKRNRERGIQRFEVRFLMRLGIFYVPRSWQDEKTFYLILFTNTFYVGHQMERYFRRACQVYPWTTVGYFFCNLGKNLSWHLYYLCYSFYFFLSLNFALCLMCRWNCHPCRRILNHHEREAPSKRWFGDSSSRCVAFSMGFLFGFFRQVLFTDCCWFLENVFFLRIFWFK